MNELYIALAKKLAAIEPPKGTAYVDSHASWHRSVLAVRDACAKIDVRFDEDAWTDYVLTSSTKLSFMKSV